MILHLVIIKSRIFTANVTCSSCAECAGAPYIIAVGASGGSIIGDYAFNDCVSITTLVIGNSVTAIGDYAFYGCESITTLVIGNSVTAIGDYAFGKCTGLSSVIIPSLVTSVGDFTFSGCLGLTSVTIIGNSVTTMGRYVFSMSYGLRNAYLGCDLPYDDTSPLFRSSFFEVNVVRLSCAPTSGKMYSYCSNRLLNSYPTVNICSVIGRL